MRPKSDPLAGHRLIQRRYRNTPKSKRARRVFQWRSSGLTAELFDQMVIAQGGLCSICLQQLRQLHVDHDHQTGAIRGLLCPGCNMGLGNFRDDPKSLIRAALYLL